MEADQCSAEREPERHRFLTLYLPYLVLAAVAIFWPAETAVLGVDFRDSWWTQSVPSIAGYVANSEFPSATAAYLVLSGPLFMPLFAYSLLRPEIAFSNRAQAREVMLKYRRRRPYLMLLAIAVGIVGVGVSWIQPGYEEFPLSSRRWVLALGGPLLGFFSMSYGFVFIAVMGVRFSFFVPLEEVRDGME